MMQKRQMAQLHPLPLEFQWTLHWNSSEHVYTCDLWENTTYPNKVFKWTQENSINVTCFVGSKIIIPIRTHQNLMSLDMWRCTRTIIRCSYMSKVLEVMWDACKNYSRSTKSDGWNLRHNLYKSSQTLQRTCLLFTKQFWEMKQSLDIVPMWCDMLRQFH